MNNFEFEHKGKKLWYSRSLAVSCLVYTKNPANKKTYVLANLRGPGCEFNKGLWNVPGGFIDFNETAEQAASRECHEETGLDIPESAWHFAELDTRPVGKRQTMVARYTAFVNWNECSKFTTKYSEPGEVQEIRWICLDEVEFFLWTNRQEEAIHKFSVYNLWND